MKQLLFLLISLLLLNTVCAQEFDVRTFEADLSDVAARRYPRTTVNDETAALIKVVTNIEGMIFDSNLGIVDVERREAEYWVYVSPRERRIRLMAADFLAKDVRLPEPAQSHTVYHLVVTRKGMLAPVTDLVRLTFRLNEDAVYIRRGDQAPVPTVGNMAVFNIEKGEHSFHFIKEGFDEKTLTLDVRDDQEVFVELTPGQVTTPFEPPGFIVITSEQRGAEVYLNEQRVGVTPYQNTHISGEYSLMLRHSDYHDHYQTFSLEAGATMTIPTVNLLPRYGFFEVTSTPSGAEVLLNNSLVGRTPLPTTQISSGYHELAVRYSMYHDHRESFTIEDGTQRSFNVGLMPAFGGLRITSEPSGARVFIAGREVGVTPYENMRHPSGRYSVRISRELFGDAMETIEVSDGEIVERFVPMTPNYGVLEVLAEGAEIFLDGWRIANDSHLTHLEPGRYVLKAVKPLHHDDEREVFIRLGQRKKITLSPQPKTGYVSISSEPFETRGAEIWIHGVRQQQVTPAVIPLLEGSYEVRLKKFGFVDTDKKIHVKENETVEAAITMESSTSVNITSNPTGADVHINGELVGQTPHTLNLGFGNYNVSLKKNNSFINQVISVEPGRVNSFRLNLLTEVNIRTRPEGATVSVQGQDRIVAPGKLLLPQGSNTLHVKKDNYLSRSRSVLVRSETESLNVRLRPRHLGGIGYVMGPHGVNGGFEVFLKGKMTIGLSIMEPDALAPVGYDLYKPQAISAFIGYRIPYPLDFSLHLGYGVRYFHNAHDSNDRISIGSGIIGAILPINFSPTTSLYLKGDYWLKTEAKGIFVFSFGLVTAMTVVTN